MRIEEILRPLAFLVGRKNEWGGEFDPLTGEVRNLREGDRSSFPSEAELMTEEGKGGIWRVEAGWLSFHSHPEDLGSYPSGLDHFAAQMRGAPSYIITKRGFWEIRPMKAISREEIKHLDEEAWGRAEILSSQYGDDAYWFWREDIKTLFPVEVRLIKPEADDWEVVEDW